MDDIFSIHAGALDDAGTGNLNDNQNIQQAASNTDPITPPNGDDNGNLDDGGSDLPAIYRFLQEKGIEDPSKIKYQTDEGETEDVDFNSLPADEQLTILKEITDAGLQQHEIDTINYLRTNNVSFEDAVKYFQEKAIEEYLNEHPEDIRTPQYDIDNFSDDELYFADIKSKYPVLSDEEISIELEKAKENEDLFKKKVDILREAYKEQEDLQKQEAESLKEQAYEDLKNNLIDIVSQFDEVSLDYTDVKSDTLVIEDEDKEQILSYLLDTGSDGQSQFVRDINNPERLIELALFMTKGQELISGVSHYWKDILKNERKEISKLKKELEQKPNEQAAQQTVHVRPSSRQEPITNQKQNPNSEKNLPSMGSI